MAVNLQAELEPLLSKLRQVANDECYKEMEPQPDADAEQWLRFQSDLEGFDRGLLSDLISRFRGYYSLDGIDLEPLKGMFAEPSDTWESPMGHSVYCSIARACDDVDQVSKMIHNEQWVGDAAQAFQRNFLDRFKTAAVVHAACSRELAVAATALAEGVERAKECVVWICKNTISWLDGSVDPGPIPGRKGDWHKDAGMLAILADAVALFAAVASAEIDALDVILAATGVSGGILAESGDQESAEEGAPINLMGFTPTVQGKLHEAFNCLTSLDLNIAELDEKINRVLENSLGSSGPFGSGFAKLDDPALKPSAYQQLDFKGLDDAKDQVVVSLVRLYYAGHNVLPAAAQEYDLGVRVCSGAHITGVDQQFPRSARKFNEAAEDLGGFMSSISRDLTNSGEALVSAASAYEYTDAYEAAQIKRYIADIPSPGNFAAADHYTPPDWLIP